MSHRLTRLCPKTRPLGFAHLCRSLPSGFIPAGSILRDVLGWMIVPGADDMQLYQPTHKLAYNL